MKRQLFIAISLLLTPVAQGETQPWWQGDSGYASTDGFHSELNKGKPVGTPMADGTAVTKAATELNGQKRQDPNWTAAQKKPDGQMETEAERLIRINQFDPSIAPSARKEVLGTPGNTTSPGQLGLDEKLNDAATIAKIGADTGGAQSAVLAFSAIGGSIAAACGTDWKCQRDEADKILAQRKIYDDNAQTLAAAASDLRQGVRRLTRDYYKLEPKGPTGGGQAGTLVAGSVKYDDAAAGKREAAIDKALGELSPEQLAQFEEKGIDAKDFMQKFMDGEFESGEELLNYLGANDSGAGSGMIGKGTQGDGDAEDAPEGRVTASAGNVETGPVLNIQNGSFISFGAKKNANAKSGATGGQASGDDDTTLMTALANFIGAQAKGLGMKADAAGNGRGRDAVTEKDRRALLDFAVTWWKTQDQPAPAIPDGARQRTIFDIARDSYSAFRGTRAVKAGPVAFNNR